jgi:hypothetical protein
MGLPVIQHPVFTLTLPSTKQKINYRPFLVKEEKMLLIAQSSGESSDIVRAVKQVVANCILTDTVNVDDFTTYDLEYFFIKLRSKSVQNIIKLTYRDRDDEQLYEVEVDLETVEVKQQEEVVGKVEIDEKSGILLRYPRVSILNGAEDVENGVDFNFFILQACIDKIYNDGVTHDPSEFTKEELQAFVDSLSVPVYQQIQKFIDAMPRVEHVISYTNSNGKKVEIVLKTLTDFFTLG